MPTVGGAFAAILLIGSVTLGSTGVFFRLTHPGLVIGFAADCIQLAGAATVQLVRNKASGHRLKS
jgi:hypothetical protein